MFAYCNNDPVNYLDKHGNIPTRDFAYASTFYEPRGGGPDIRQPIGIGTQSEFAKESEDLFWDAMNINSVEDAVDVYDRVTGYNIVEDTLELNSIRSGWTYIRRGVRTIVVSPDPTFMDEQLEE